MWPFKRKAVDQEYRARAAQVELAEDDKGQILERCASDVERRSLCLQWAGKARTDWYEGRRQHIAYVIASNHPRYKQYSLTARRAIGEQMWVRSVMQKDLASLEQMYTRWAESFAGGKDI
jgi:hypothetical protein